jgi:hypothetical protein
LRSTGTDFTRGPIVSRPNRRVVEPTDDEESPELSEEELTRDQVSLKAKKKRRRKRPMIYAELEHKVDIYKKDAWESEHQNKYKTKK